MPETMTGVQAIRKYFFPADAKAGEILAEVKKLTPADREELAQGAARELGATLAEAK
jgi:hypothetical protein